ncbi:Carboxyl-terminal PDZ ligand of neuronal nitric oxide synthase protein [Liparis tanakae]|uniref:Carboxyl-terminal PDZ ligand of neuronal nitric oxide synthase protein n=1 Tax=Liparis tanakae TaxID=230148 RepID=A0A4Z2IFU9_9TELE|nr:Carboxyl-terminal PDZ ligand of neuronal nitric oxide synthase protein [Liparis tanakae]
MPAKTKYNLVDDGHDLRIPLHNEEAFQHGINFEAKRVDEWVGEVQLPTQRWRFHGLEECKSEEHKARHPYKKKQIKASVSFTDPPLGLHRMYLDSFDGHPLGCLLFLMIHAKSFVQARETKRGVQRDNATLAPRLTSELPSSISSGGLVISPRQTIPVTGRSPLCGRVSILRSALLSLSAEHRSSPSLD